MGNKVIGLEGIDGTGKTTVGKLLAEVTNLRYFHNMEGNSLAPYKNDFETAAALPRFLYYLSVGLDYYPRVEDLRQKSNVLVDRTVYCAIAYHRAYGLGDELTKIVPQYLYDQFDRILYFHLNEQTRRERLIARGMTPDDERSFEFGKRVEEEYYKILPQSTVFIDVDNKAPETIVSELIQTVPEIGNIENNI